MRSEIINKVLLTFILNAPYSVIVHGYQLGLDVLSMHLFFHEEWQYTIAAGRWFGFFESGKCCCGGFTC